ncbi:phosphonate ABC transporter, ATP-binding protein [Crocosphaera subtropica ATCC 51142]|uniref:Phosphonate ABC transporter, ATP-binding protein n=1 Tax=Crocosphaera subtropica (strain ATCC 51142 / BH68) TaxID=43989 RepID=B1WSB9_CROS5|nr:phosphonate ABC transporter ATP-binding protein [Crocosphaera subtropica]ACB51905.1 phosphonate ABC transporter, ATP-binding protein [Crocosphaera subtropica ATCC 51142]
MIFLNNLSVTYKDGTVALENISLELIPGEFTVLLGASGAGKSTLLRCINFLTVPTKGEVIVEGLGTLNNPKILRKHRQKTGMIFQQHQLIPRQTALKNVLVGRLAYHSTLRSFFPLPKIDQMIALDCLDRVGLLNKALTPVKQLSGGQQQRVGIARALAQKPRFLLADEPVASLDPGSSHKILTNLKKICQEDGIGAVVSLHQIDFALDYGDRIIGLADGNILFDSHPSEIQSYQLEKIYHNSSLIKAG